MVCIRPSRIDRHGLFAAQDIQKGTRIIQYAGTKIPKAEGGRRAEAGNEYIFELNERYDIDGKALSNTARYINHSCDPNCTVETTSRTIWIIARRDIASGEELTYNYGYDIKDYTNHPCRCGAANCCGYILAQQYWDLIQLQEDDLA